MFSKDKLHWSLSAASGRNLIGKMQIFFFDQERITLLISIKHLIWRWKGFAESQMPALLQGTVATDISNETDLLGYAG